MSDNLERICTVDISLATPISNNANFDNSLIIGPLPKAPKATSSKLPKALPRIKVTVPTISG